MDNDVSPIGWSKSTPIRADADVRLSFLLAIPQTQIDTAALALDRMSNPKSAHYGQHWTRQRIAEHFTPQKRSMRLVSRWLNESGADTSRQKLSVEQGSISVVLPLHKAEELLGARLHEYTSHDGGETLVAPESNTHPLPAEIANEVHFVHASLVDKPEIPQSPIPIQARDAKPKPKATAAQLNCFRYMSPECIRLLYNIPAPTTNDTSHPNNSLGIFLPSWQTWIPEELDSFFAAFQPELIGQRPTVLPVNGGYRQTGFVSSIFNMEPHLDFEYSMALAYPLPVSNIQVGSYAHVGNTNLMLAAFSKDHCTTGIDPTFDSLLPNGTDCGTLTPPLVISISAAWNEASFSAPYLHRQCLEFLKLGLLGTTVIAATGDHGTADQLRECRDPSTGTPGPLTGQFSANFPASCPWVTAVGGTQLDLPLGTNTTFQKGITPFPPETAFRHQQQNRSTIYTPGGGFSHTFPTPSYQRHAVNSYLSRPLHQSHLSNLSAGGYFSPSGRGYPDISTTALNYLVHTGGRLTTVSGTSASAPVFAAMVARVNDARLKAGKAPVGFVNPVLYGVAADSKAVRDTATGWNAGCGVDQAFPAVEGGWDAVTGLGTPDFGGLLEMWIGLP
ncbi:alkaline serine protease [Podospora aff. communis PSN243]|uniref:tripeptidyl-peptidase II n=1 Tax=Podospora aff. communis PSN243 TaxID=3040156 RepID=A0AAV9GGV0_9PEZI|nr:alkaline serine protease [Podospora aff. communis PSN243]